MDPEDPEDPEDHVDFQGLEDNEVVSSVIVYTVCLDFLLNLNIRF